ncbi:GNAT family N-acetyltransferase [Terrabacter sp. MAHUQ-38]|uniref:GNAT family N-acetyltransferase n=1 Tax=unclassified Terrabacter TaxID=2630222 RepID=UPI00165D8069|nr:GNAT family N-acetyltransferase [Terrabacter sp. MAHUQ-38]MBC9821735.1 GNAT family N-acetyltransferase [Terrabacter sp. MAHUQ-38]
MSASDPAAVVRSATGQDVPALAAVAAATFELACPPSMTRERVEAFVSEVLSAARFTEYTADPARHLLLAERRGETLGYAMLVAGEPSDDDVRAAIRHRPTVELSKIYVLPRAHGTGAATLLMNRSLAWARDRGAAGVWLGVNQENERAQRFYAKSGFERVGKKRFLVGGTYEDDFVMEQSLRP